MAAPTAASTTTTVTASPSPQTWVFLDLETSGFITRATGPPQILELTMYAVQDRDMDSGHFPRVVNKLTVAFQPRQRLQLKISEITGLTDELLQTQQPLDEAAGRMILSFLGRLRAPVCLLAHNGKAFDFPVLWAELSDLGLQLPRDLLCADTLHGFRAAVPQAKIGCSNQPFKMTNLYENTFHREMPGGHSSEGDVRGLVELCLHPPFTPTLTPWLRRAATPFASLVPAFCTRLGFRLPDEEVENLVGDAKGDGNVWHVTSTPEARGAAAQGCGRREAATCSPTYCR